MDNPLAALILAEVKRSQYISFARFMELALYHPELGYYRRRTANVFGVHGDFYTAGQLQPVFGDLLSSFIARLAGAGNTNRPFEVLDLGAGRQDLRAALHRWHYRAFDWNTEALPPAMTGVIIANEFFDALPANLLRKRGAEWREVVVKAEGEKLVFDEAGDISPALTAYARLYGAFVPDGGLLEVSLAAREWIKRIGALLRSGSLLIIDYGYELRELARFPEGTLLAYQGHSATDDLLAKPGEKDLTAHVNFAYLRDCALESGFEVTRQSSLGSWALSVWDESELAARWNKVDERWHLQWKQFIFGLGDTFRVLQLQMQPPKIKTPPLPEA